MDRRVLEGREMEEKGIKIWHAHASISHKECTHYVLQTCSSERYIFDILKLYFKFW